MSASTTAASAPSPQMHPQPVSVQPSPLVQPAPPVANGWSTTESPTSKVHMLRSSSRPQPTDTHNHDEPSQDSPADGESAASDVSEEEGAEQDDEEYKGMDVDVDDKQSQAGDGDQSDDSDVEDGEYDSPEANIREDGDGDEDEEDEDDETGPVDVSYSLLGKPYSQRDRHLSLIKKANLPTQQSQVAQFIVHMAAVGKIQFPCSMSYDSIKLYYRRWHADFGHGLKPLGVRVVMAAAKQAFIGRSTAWFSERDKSVRGVHRIWHFPDMRKHMQACKRPVLRLCFEQQSQPNTAASSIAVRTSAVKSHKARPSTASTGKATRETTSNREYAKSMSSTASSTVSSNWFTTQSFGSFNVHTCLHCNQTFDGSASALDEHREFHRALASAYAASSEISSRATGRYLIDSLRHYHSLSMLALTSNQLVGLNNLHSAAADQFDAAIAHSEYTWESATTASVEPNQVVRLLTSILSRLPADMYRNTSAKQRPVTAENSDSDDNERARKRRVVDDEGQSGKDEVAESHMKHAADTEQRCQLVEDQLATMTSELNTRRTEAAKLTQAQKERRQILAQLDRDVEQKRKEAAAIEADLELKRKRAAKMQELLSTL